MKLVESKGMVLICKVTQCVTNPREDCVGLNQRNVILQDLHSRSCMSPQRERVDPPPDPHVARGSAHFGYHPSLFAPSYALLRPQPLPASGLNLGSPAPALGPPMGLENGR